MYKYTHHHHYHHHRHHTAITILNTQQVFLFAVLLTIYVRNNVLALAYLVLLGLCNLLPRNTVYKSK